MHISMLHYQMVQNNSERSLVQNNKREVYEPSLLLEAFVPAERRAVFLDLDLNLIMSE